MSWQEVTVEKLAAPSPNALATGPFGSAISSQFFQSDGIPVIRGSNLTDTVGERLVEDDLVFVGREKADEFSRSLVRRGDLVFTCWGTVGQVGLIDQRARFNEYVISNKQMKLTPDPAKADSLFLYYLFSSPAVSETIKNQAIGSSVPGFNLGQLRSLRIRLPPLDEQRVIAALLGVLDDKIDLNRRMSETLDAMARALFKSWFVDFDPVRAKALGQRPDGMDAETAKLFPDTLVEIDGQEVPNGWQVIGLDRVADFRNGLALQRFRPKDEEARLPVVKIAQLRTGQADGGEWARADIDPACILEDGDLVFSWSGSLAVVIWCGGRAALNQHLFRVTSARYPKSFVCQWLMHHLPEFQRIASDKATTMGHIQRHHLSIAKCIVPGDEVLAAACDRLEPLLKMVIANELQARTLATVRDALLPRLLSGDLRVSPVERVAESAL